LGHEPSPGFRKVYLMTLTEQKEMYTFLEEVLATGCKGNLTDLRRILHLSLAKGNPKLIYKSK
jgi:hypothetical protein